MGFGAHGIALVSFPELAAGKLSALMDRQASRDGYAASRLLATPFDAVALRCALVVLRAMSLSNPLEDAPERVAVDRDEARQRLLPLLRQGERALLNQGADWIDQEVVPSPIENGASLARPRAGIPGPVPPSWRDRARPGHLGCRSSATNPGTSGPALETVEYQTECRFPKRGSMNRHDGSLALDPMREGTRQAHRLSLLWEWITAGFGRSFGQALKRRFPV